MFAHVVYSLRLQCSSISDKLLIFADLLSQEIFKKFFDVFLCNFIPEIQDKVICKSLSRIKNMLG